MAPAPGKGSAGAGCWCSLCCDRLCQGPGFASKLKHRHACKWWTCGRVQELQHCTVKKHLCLWQGSVSGHDVLLMLVTCTLCKGSLLRHTMAGRSLTVLSPSSFQRLEDGYSQSVVVPFHLLFCCFSLSRDKLLEQLDGQSVEMEQLLAEHLWLR